MDDIYVKQNAFNTKDFETANLFAMLSAKNVVFMDTFHKDYNMTRKVLSAAFFKNKLKAITKVIKEETIEFIAEI